MVTQQKDWSFDPYNGWLPDTNITIKDNWFSDVDYVRELGINCETVWRVSDKPENGDGWRGIRSVKFKTIGNKELLKMEKDIFNYVWEERNLSAWRYPEWEIGLQGDLKKIYNIKKQKLEDNPLIDPMITTYFHRSPANTVNAFWDFYTDRFHKDYISCAGVIFLNPNPPALSGTSILDARNINFINVENIYNRLIAYDGYNLHAQSGCFGDSPESSRLTIVFFIHEKVFAEQYT